MRIEVTITGMRHEIDAKFGGATSPSIMEQVLYKALDTQMLIDDMQVHMETESITLRHRPEPIFTFKLSGNGRQNI